MTYLVFPEPLKELEYTRRKTGLWASSSFHLMGLSRREYGARKCCCVECEHCDPADHIPKELQVVIAGMADDSCYECASFNGTYVLAKHEDAYGSACVWRYVFSPAVCGANYMFALIWKSGLDYILSVTAYNRWAAQSRWAFWLNLGTTKPDCRSWSDTSIPVKYQQYCNLTAATCLITSL